MDHQVIMELSAYDRWATGNIFAAAAGLSPDLLNQQTGTGYGGIFETLVHLVAADVIWMSRLHGSSPTALAQPSDFASLEDVHRRWVALHDDWALFMDRLPESGLNTHVSYQNTRGVPFNRPVWHILLHMVNHGTHHRSELSEMLTIHGRPHTALDMHDYLARIGRVP